MPLANNLGAFPKPFFDPSGKKPLNLTFTFASRPSLPELQAAGVVASAFGAMADTRGAHFPVKVGAFPAGNVVCVIDRSAGVPLGLELDDLSGPAVAVRANPTDKSSKVLVVLGDTSEELLTAARGFALKKHFQKAILMP